jgi:hypothetical protein
MIRLRGDVNQDRRDDLAQQVAREASDDDRHDSWMILKIHPGH